MATKGYIKMMETSVDDRVDKFFEGAKDFNDNYLPLGFRERDVVLGNVKEKALPRYLPAFEKVTHICLKLS